MRMRKKKWTATELTNNPRILQDPVAYAGRLRAYFGDDRPVHVELGCGKGRFVALSSLNDPDTHYVAVEREPTVLAAAARLAAAMDAPPVFLLLDADALETVFIPGDINRLYLNFSDPWPNKKKWAKRRLTHAQYLAIYERLGIPEIFLKTDNRALFAFSIESFSANGWRLRNVSLDLHRDNPEGNIMTEYEEKFAALGQPIYRLEAYRVYDTNTECSPETEPTASGTHNIY